MTRPRNDELASVAKFLREEIARDRGYARGAEKMAAVSPAKDYKADYLAEARRRTSRADRFEKVADWLKEQANNAQSDNRELTAGTPKR
jgi:hypothetical protein